MNSEYPNEVVEAKTTIEQFTGSTLLDKIETAPKIISAVIKLQKYIQESMNSSNSKKISTFLQTHTLKFLEFLGELNRFGPDRKDWIFIRFTLLALKSELRKVIEIWPDLAEDYRIFVDLWSENIKNNIEREMKSGKESDMNKILLMMCEP